MKKIVHSLLSIVLLGGLWATQTAEWIAGSGGPSGSELVEERLDVTLDQESFKRHLFQRKPGVVLIFDDGYASFVTQVMAASDSLYDTWSNRWGASIPAQRVRATCGIVPEDIGGGSIMSWAQLATFANRQKDFEVATHGNADSRLGSEAVGFSYAYFDSILRATQDSLVAHGVARARTHKLGNWRYTPGGEAIWLKNGYTSNWGLNVPASFNHSQVQGNELVGMNINTDAYVNSTLGLTANMFWCYQGYGRIRNRWNVGHSIPTVAVTNGGGGWDPATTDSILAAIDGAVQAGAIAGLTFHNVEDPDDALDIHPDSLRKVFRHIDSLMAFGWIESLTSEQAVARGTGHVVGELIWNPGFRRLSDISTRLDNLLAGGAACDTVPIGWPLPVQHTVYTAEGRWLQGTGAPAGSWKVNEVATIDTIAGMFARASDANLTYGMSTPGSAPGWTKADTLARRNVVIQEMQSTTRSDDFLIPPIPVTGVRSSNIKITVQVMSPDSVTNASAGADSICGYIAARFFCYDEVWDPGRSQQAAYSFDVITPGLQVAGIDNPRTSLLRIQNSVALLDTLLADSLFTRPDTTTVVGTNIVRARQKGWVGDNRVAERFRHLWSGVLPPMIWDHTYANANYLDVSIGDPVATNTLSTMLELPSMDNGLHYENYTWTVEIIPGVTDFVVGQVRFDELAGGAWSNRYSATAPTVVITHVGAMAN